MTNKLDYQITFIKVQDLSVVWVKSQRPFNQAWANHIADTFDPDKFEPIIVTKPNGQGIYHIVEGQHRKAGFEQWANDPTQQVPCRIIDHGDPAKAAEIWLGINKGRKPVRPVTEFLVAVEAKREDEVAINDIVKKCGYFVASSGSNDNAISAVAALRRVYNLGGRVLYHTLQATRLMWGNDPQGVSSHMLVGVGIFMNEFHSHVEAARLRKAVLDKYKSPYRLIDAAAIRRDNSSDPLPMEVAEVIRRAYNYGLRADKKLMHKEG